MDHEQHSSQYAGALKHYFAPLHVGLQLTKPGIIFGNLASVLGGYFLASDGHLTSASHLAATLLGTALIIGSGCVVNNCVDRDIDRRMVRTCHRALAIRLIPVWAALCYAVALGIAGFSLLWFGTNAVACLLALTGLVIYAGIYSCWLKRSSLWGTLIGSLSGAMPPVIGYCAVSGQFDLNALLLIAVFCCWQMPHSHAISVMRQDDFRAAGLPLLTPSRAQRQIKGYMYAFMLSALALGLAANINAAYFLAVVGLGGYWMVLAYSSTRLADARQWARKIFTFSIVLILGLNLTMALGTS